MCCQQIFLIISIHFSEPFQLDKWYKDEDWTMLSMVINTNPSYICKYLSWYGNRVSISEDKCYFTTKNLWNLTNHIYKLNIEYKHIRISNTSQYLNYCIIQKGCIRVYYWLILKWLASIWKLQPPSNSEECLVCSLNKIHSNSKCCCLF